VDTPKFLWNASSSCDSNFNKKYSSQFPYYCGYYALDLTDTTLDHPVPQWKSIQLSNSDQGKYLDEPWSKVAIGRVKINGSERWVGFIGGGYSLQGRYNDDDDSTANKRGKGFFVIDLKDGTILWSYTKGNNSNMDYCLPAPPAIVDRDNDGFVDAAYIGDQGGNIWKFTFCSFGNTLCNTTNWVGSLFFEDAGQGGNRPIYTAPTVAKDANYIWVFWGTGDKTDPTSPSAQEKFIAIKDQNLNLTYRYNNLQNIGATGTYTSKDSNVYGWYFNFSGQGEKMLADPTIYGGAILFTTYTPGNGGEGNHCNDAGTGSLYALAMQTIAINGIIYEPGKGLFSESGTRSMALGTGIPSSPVLSGKPDRGATDLYVSTGGGGGQDTQIHTSSEFPTSPLTTLLQNVQPAASIISWRDRRVR
jgi:type IV pilus assembly protein PilY1